MPQIKRNTLLPTAELPAPVTTFDFDEESNELVVTARFPFDYPDEAVINRYGRAPKDDKGKVIPGAEKPITQKTYGKGIRIFTGSADAEDNPMFLSMRLFAETKDAEAESAASSNDDDE